MHSDGAGIVIGLFALFREYECNPGRQPYHSIEFKINIIRCTNIVDCQHYCVLVDQMVKRAMVKANLFGFIRGLAGHWHSFENASRFSGSACVVGLSGEILGALGATFRKDGMDWFWEIVLVMSPVLIRNYQISGAIGFDESWISCCKFEKI